MELAYRAWECSTFGHPILPLSLFVDPLLVEQNEIISFNAGMPPFDCYA